MTVIEWSNTSMVDTTPKGEPDDTELEHSIDTGSRQSTIRRLAYLVRKVRDSLAVPEALADDSAWIEASLPALRRMAELPDDWDSEGSITPSPSVIASIRVLLDRLRNGLGAIPIPFICPVPGGGVQFEWNSPKKQLEIEFTEDGRLVFLKEERTPFGERTESGDFAAADVESARQLLDWFAAI
jgi:hypothetical protein